MVAAREAGLGMGEPGDGRDGGARAARGEEGGVQGWGHVGGVEGDVRIGEDTGGRERKG